MFDIPGSPGRCYPLVGEAALCSNMMWPSLCLELGGKWKE